MGLLSETDCTLEQPDETLMIKPLLTKTIQAICKFQKIIFHGNSYGIIKPEKETIKMLSTIDKPSFDKLKSNYEQSLSVKSKENNQQEASKYKIDISTAMPKDNTATNYWYQQVVDPFTKKEEAETKAETSTYTGELFARNSQNPNSKYIDTMLQNKSEGKWQLEDLTLNKELSEVDQRVDLARQIDNTDSRKYKALSIADGRLIDNFVDCCEFVSEVLWAQGYEKLPTADCLVQLEWFKSNGEWGTDFNEIKLGDIIFWDNTKDGLGKEDVDYTTKKNLDHVGIVTEKLSTGEVKIIHASVNGGRESIHENKNHTNKSGHNYFGTKDEQIFVAWARTKRR